MIAWLSANIGTILITLVLAAVVFLIVRSMIRHKKASGSFIACEGGCSTCGNGACKGHCSATDSMVKDLDRLPRK